MFSIGNAGNQHYQYNILGKFNSYLILFAQFRLMDFW